ncbi:MAG: 30S ribosome-binding factor RbfA [Rhodobacterales bacterium]|jgi:ribosome-binding factor A|nr:30S ribosome-binding factor RbfA [Pseudomonadota bacterium]MDA1286031.1 30S ribosome-binding factor RbfA [Pseudomonadota bacterium]NQW12997.1 30S ribosome-binding factor RbfA [Rhodobacter sp.]
MNKRRSNENTGPGQRQLRVGELIRRVLSEVLARGDLYDPEIAHVSITVGEVRASNDLKSATVHVMPLGGLNTDIVVAALNRNKVELRRHLNRNIELKFSPELTFVPDLTFDQIDETRRLFSQETVMRDIAAPDTDD